MKLQVNTHTKKKTKNDTKMTPKNKTKLKQKKLTFFIFRKTMGSHCFAKNNKTCMVENMQQMDS